MGSVEYLRVRINQQLQMLRHVYRDTNAEKAAIKVAKQRVINERMATQNERAKLLMAIDHNKYFWPPDSQPVRSHVVLLFKKYFASISLAGRVTGSDSAIPAQYFSSSSAN